MLACLGCTERKQRRLLDAAEDKASENLYAEAAELYRKTIAVNPDSEIALKAIYRLAFTSEIYLRDFEAAIFNYNEYLKKGSDKVSVYEALKRLGNIYYDQFRDPDKTISTYRKLIEYDPESSEIDLFQIRIGHSYFRQNNFEQARTEFQALLDKFPKSAHAPRVRFEIGNTYYMEGRYDIAAEALRQVGRNFPQSEYAVEADFLLAQCLEQSQKLKEALQVYENLRTRYPSKEIIEYRVAELKKRIKKVR